ncbi:dihydroorotase [Methanohalophilus sp.]
MNDILIKNTKVFYKNQLQPGEVLIDEGKIKRIAKNLKDEDADRHIDAHGGLTIPAGIDVHVHFREPGMTHKEDWYSGSCAAAAGGIGTVVEHPNTLPPILDRKSFREKFKLANRKSIIDFGINGGVGENIEKLETLWELGVTAFGEIFMAESTAGLGLDSELLKEALETIQQLGALACIHAEDENIKCDNEILLKKDFTPQSHSRIRSNKCEAMAVKNALDLSSLTSANTHFCHISTLEAFGQLKKEKYILEKEDVSRHLSFEVAPHHLFLSDRDWERLGTFGKMNPPLRNRQSVKALVNGINDGTVDVVASDHAPHRESEKEGDIKSAPSGVPGVETLMPLMMVGAKRNLFPLKRLIEVTSSNPARIFGLDNHGKGVFAEGYDADLIIMDPGNVKPINSDMLHSKAGWTPYEGMEGIFPEYTISRGEIIWDGDIVGRRGRGDFLPGGGSVKDYD